MIFKEPAHLPAAGEPSGGESQGRVGATQPDARSPWAFDYMDEEIEEVRIAVEPAVVMPEAAVHPSSVPGRD